ncbi:MAG TPA: efflux transporter outer membrane subunit [Usitatibacter sp.]|nr:efflux transporter outer membrane subunit [Usitatibacter sp.]
MRAHAAVILLCCAASGCMFGPNYSRPDVKAPEAFRYEPREVAAAADVEWWKRMNDPVLDALIAEALANSQTVKIAAANVEQAAAVLATTRSAFFPQVGYNAAATRQKLSQNSLALLPPGVPNPATTYQVLAGASWEIDLWGRVRRLSESAQANLLATEEARRGVILSLVGTVATSYLQLRGLDEQLMMSERTLKTYESSLQIMQYKFQYGRVGEMEVEQARARYQTAAAQIPQIKRDIATVENALSILLGRAPGPITRGLPIFEMSLPAVPPGVPSELLERRPDLRQAEQQLIAANAQIGAAKALYFPAISLTGSLGSASSELSGLFKGPANSWSYAANLAGPIFTGGAISGQVAQAEAGQKAALAAYRLAIQNAFADVENALVTRTTLDEQVAAQEKLVVALRKYSRFAQMQFEGGRAPYSTVLQAEQELFPAELTWAALRAQLSASVVDIYKAMGGGWVDTAASIADAQAKDAKP